MGIFFIILAIVFAVQIFREKGVRKLPWFFAGILFFPGVIPVLNTPATNFPHFIIFALLFSTIFQEKNWLASYRRFPLKNAMLIILVALLLIGIFDNRLALYLKLYRPINYFLDHFFVIFLTFYYIKKKEDVLYIYDKLIIMLLVMGLYGLLNIVTGRNEYMSFLTSSFGGFDGANLNMTQGRSRFRISSFTSNPIYYGYVLSAVLMIMIFMLNFVKMNKRRRIYVGIFFLLVVNLFLVNSRTPLVAFIAGAAVFIMFAVQLQNKIRILISCIFLLFVGASIFPDSLKIIDKTINTISSNEKETDGSTLEMREVQLSASMLIFYKSPVLGNGFKYIIEDLGFSGDASDRKSDSDLKGFESYIYVLLIEQGLVGIAGNIIFFLMSFLWLKKIYRRVDNMGKKYVWLSVGMLIAVLFFAIATGELGTFLIFMSIQGINMKAIILCRKEGLVKKKNLTLNSMNV